MNVEFGKKVVVFLHRSRNPLLFPIRLILLGASSIFSFFAQQRVRRYLKHSEKQYRPSRPVISVGNISVGGTGKTPLIAYLLDFFSDQKVVVLSRGYKSGEQAKNDEVLLLERDFPHQICRVGANRVQNCQHSERTDSPDLFLLDDGFQHLKLTRTLDLVLYDALMPKELAYPIPAGLLREPLSALKRADLLIITHADQLFPQEQSALKAWLQHYTLAPICLAQHQILGWRDLQGQEYAKDYFQDQFVLACCAIGNPEGFRKSLLKLKINVQDFFIFPDHHHYSPEEMQHIFQKYPQVPLLTTGKDMVKLKKIAPSEIFLYEAILKIELFEGEDFLKKSLNPLKTR